MEINALSISIMALMLQENEAYNNNNISHSAVEQR